MILGKQEECGMQYWDIVIHTNADIFDNEQLASNFPPVQQRLAISTEVWVERLEQPLAKAVMDTCEPQFLGLVPPVRQFAQLYSFIRELRFEDMYRFDHDNVLTSTIALSRLVHPTSLGLFYAARVGMESGQAKKIFPSQISGISKDVFLSPNRKRNWLTATDVQVLTELTPHMQSQLPKRVHNAFWQHEYAARTYYLDYRWTLVCTGLEALLHTDRGGSTAQFRGRVPKLASEVGINITEAEADEAYDLRSRLAHGASFLSSANNQGVHEQAQLHLYDRLEDVLRLAVLRAMRDKTFAAIFLDDTKIRQRWPK
jgi:hypothetical protein